MENFLKAIFTSPPARTSAIHSATLLLYLLWGYKQSLSVLHSWRTAHIYHELISL